jgi:hypothetical protein
MNLTELALRELWRKANSYAMVATWLGVLQVRGRGWGCECTQVKRGVNCSMCGSPQVISLGSSPLYRPVVQLVNNVNMYNASGHHLPLPLQSYGLVSQFKVFIEASQATAASASLFTISSIAIFDALSTLLHLTAALVVVDPLLLSFSILAFVNFVSPLVERVETLCSGVNCFCCW